MTVGPIIFGHESARSQLLDEGEVYTFRTSERTTGETWARASRTGPKIADVTVEKVCAIPAPSPGDFNREWGRKSGFGTVESWWNGIHDVHGENIQSGVVYHVTLRGEGATANTQGTEGEK